MKTALVTGASSGLGGAISRHLARNGYRVGLHYHSNRAAAERVHDSILADDGQADLITGDLTRAEACHDCLKEWLGTDSTLDALINNAGVYEAVSLEDMSEEQWRRGLDSTATATFFMTRAALPYLRRSGNGRVVNIGDSSCDRPGARDVAMGYHIGKTGVLMLTRSFAAQEAGHGISVNMISPGYLENSVGLPDPSVVPAGRFGQFDDILQALHFLLSENAGYCSGSNLIVSGGWNLR